MAYQGELQDEADKVAETKMLLRALGVEDADLVFASIESETNFLEAIEAKANAIGAYEQMIDACEAQAKALKARSERLDKTAQGWREEIAKAMIKAGEKKIPTATATVSVVQGRESFKVTDEAKIPTKYYKEQIDTAALKKDAVAWERERLRIEGMPDSEERDTLLAKHLMGDPTKGGGTVTFGNPYVKFYRK